MAKRATLTYPTAGEFAVELARAFAGALIFALPMLMTMEMWELGFHMEPLRLALLLAIMFPLLVRLSRRSGLRPTVSVWDDIADALVAIGVAAVTAGLVLWIFGVIGPEMSVREIVGKVALQTFPGSIGAILARTQLSSGDDDAEEEFADSSYGGEIFLMVTGALFLMLNMAPTEEMVLIAYQMQVWQEIGLVFLTLTVMHALVYSVEFSGTKRPHPTETFWSVFARFTVVGYAVVLLVSLFVLWIFCRTDNSSFQDVLSMSVVLSFPGAVGAAVARLIL